MNIPNNNHNRLEKNKISIPFLFLIISGKCNSRCITCGYWKNYYENEILSPKRIFSIVKTLSKYNLETVIFTGGEALLRSDLFEIAEEIKGKYPHLTIRLLTNGILLEEKAKYVSKIFDVVAVSFDSFNKKTYQKIRGIDAFPNIIRGIKKIRALNPKIEIRLRTVVQKENILEIPQIIELGKKLGADKISFIPADMISTIAFGKPERIKNKDRVIPSLEQLVKYRKIVKSIINEQIKKNNLKDFLIEHGRDLKRVYDYYLAIYGAKKPIYPKCNSGWTSISIDFQGNIQACFFYESIGNILETPLEKALKSDKMIKFKQKIINHNFEFCKWCTCPFYYEKNQQ